MAAHRGPLAMLMVTLAMLTACSGDRTPPPAPTSGVSPSATTATSTRVLQAPAVRNPLNAAAFEADPCASLTQAQRTQFGFVSGNASDAAVEGNSCFFRYADPKAEPVSVTFASKSTNGLSARYIDNVRGAYQYWEPAEIEGYPGVGYDPSVDLEYCSFAVGLTDSLFFRVTAADKTGSARCSTAKAVATAVVVTVKADQ